MGEKDSEARSGTMAFLLLTLLSTAITVINCSEDIQIPKHDLNTDTMITLAGYQAETHKVVTPDGYILTLYRIGGNGPVVFMQHGLEDSSAAWVIAGSTRALTQIETMNFGSSHGTRWRNTICQRNS